MLFLKEDILLVISVSGIERLAVICKPLPEKYQVIVFHRSEGIVNKPAMLCEKNHFYISESFGV
jgi:hypothetical protein